MRILPTNIDELQIEINAQATKANDAIDRLVLKLDRLTTSLGRMNTTNLNGLANGVQRLGNAMQIMNGVRTADFTRLATNLQRLGAINVSSLNSAASSMSHLTRAFNNLGTVSNNAQQVGVMAGNLARLGGANVQRAVTTIPQLATAMNNLMTTLSRAPQVSQNVIQLTNSLANLASQGSRVGTATDSINRNLNSTNRTVRSSRSSWGGFASAIGRFYASCFLAIRGINALGESIQDTADYFEAYNYFNVALGKIGSDWEDDFSEYGYESAEAYAESFATRLQERLSTLSGLQISSDGMLETTGMKNLGLNIQEITQFSAQLASVTNSVGQVGEVSLATSSAFTKLAGDMSSLFNMDYSQVATNLSSALIGQSRSVYKYGIDITNATLQTYAYSLGVEKAVSEMTQAEKMQLRLIAILDQSRVSWGDQSNTINSLANQMRILENNMSEISLVLGQLFVPLMEKALPVVNGLTIAIKNLLVNLAGILGIEIDPNKFGQGFTEIEDELDGITEGTEEAEKALEEYKNQLLGFDEVNKLQDVDAKATLDTEQTGGIDLTDEILQATEEYEKFWQQAYDEMDNLSDEWAKYFEQFTKPLEKIFVDIKLGDFFALGEDISKPINDLQLWVQDIIKGVDWAQAGKDFGDFFQGSVIESFNIFGESGTTISDIIIAITDFLTNAIDQVEWDEVVSSFVSGLTDFFRNIKVVDITFGFGKLFFSLVKAFAEAASSIFKFEDVFGVIISAFEDAYEEGLTLFGFDEETNSKLQEQLDFSDIVKDACEESKKYYDEFKQDLQDSKIEFEVETTNIEGEYAYLDNLKDKYFALANQVTLTKDEEEKLNQYKELLITQAPEFKAILEDETLSYEEQEQAIDNIIDSLKTKAKVAAAQSYISDIAAEQYQATLDLAEAEEVLNDARRNKNVALAELNSAQLKLLQAEQHLKKLEATEGVGGVEYTDAMIKVQDYRAEVERLSAIYETTTHTTANAESSVNNYKKAISDAEKQMDWYMDVAYGLVDVNSDVAASANDVATSTSNIKNGVETSVNAMLQGMGASGSYISRSIDLNINAPMRNIVDVARSSGANAGSQIGAKFATGLESSKKQATDSASRFKGSISGIVDSMKKTISDKFSIDSFSSLGTNVLKGIEKGVNNKAEQNKTTSSIATFASSIGSKFASILGIHSPSKVFEEFGEFTIEGFNIGLKDMFSDSYTLMENWGTNLKRNAETSLNGLTMATSGANFNTFATQEYSSSINVNNRDEIALLKQQNALLQQLLQKETAVISPDADGLFRVVQNKANNYTQQTGQPAFII